MVDKLFNVLLDSVRQYFVEVFCISVHQGYWPESFFVVLSLPGFGIRTMLASQISERGVPPPNYFEIVSLQIVLALLCTSDRIQL